MAKANVSYEHKDGKIFRNGEAVADLPEGGVLWCHPKCAKYRVAINNWLKTQDKPKPKAPDIPPAPDPEPPAVNPRKQPKPKVRPPVEKNWRDIREEYPGEIDPAAGDKTPAFITWLRENYPEEARKRYANRKVFDSPTTE